MVIVFWARGVRTPGADGHCDKEEAGSTGWGTDSVHGGPLVVVGTPLLGGLVRGCEPGENLGGREAPVVAGLSGDQQFFLSYAQSWRLKSRERALRRQLVEDSHAPDEYRADTVRNLDPWYAAFDVKAGQALYLAPGDRVRVW